MNYLSVPDSNLKLVDGNIVVLERFPGMKWVLHNGWYNYNGRQYMGWYFSSVPSQTILPVSNQDLRMITLVSGKSNSNEYIDYPQATQAAPAPQYCNAQCPPPYGPPTPPLPPPAPHPCGHGDSVKFTESDKKKLESSFISVATIRKRDELDTSTMPDGKIVRVNSVGGYPKYYVWSAFNDHWEELDFVMRPDLEEALSNYYTSTEINEVLNGFDEDLQAVKDDVAAVTETTTALQETVTEELEEMSSKVDEASAKADAASEKADGMSDRIDATETAINDLRDYVDDKYSTSEEVVAEYEARIAALEGVVFNIVEVDPVTGEHTVIVRYGDGIGDSNFNLGDDNIEENLDTASDTTLATEKAVVRKVEESIPTWEDF